MGELVRRDFTIEPSGNSGQLVARDAAGAIVARGATTADVVKALESMICGSYEELTPWAALVRFRSDGRVDLTGTYRRRVRPAVARTGSP